MTRWFALVWLLVGCGDEYPPPDPLPAEYTACEVPEDCVAVELGCCDACNGGLAVAVAVDQADAVVERYSERCGAAATCTLMACPDWEMTCDAGVCGMARGEFSY